MTIYKLGHLDQGEWVGHVCPATYSLSESSEGTRRLVAGVPKGNPQVFARLVESLAPPYYVLYVLHTPRGEGAPGRYQSPAIGRQEFREFIVEFSSYLACDARFDIWAHSSAENATVVWDRHNQIFGYGPLERYATILGELGFREGMVTLPAHEHHYHKAFDDQAARVLRAFAWAHSALRNEDKQLPS